MLHRCYAKITWLDHLKSPLKGIISSMYAEWGLNQMKKFGVPLPETYSVEELIYLSPAVPTDFIREHVEKRDEQGRQS